MPKDKKAPKTPEALKTLYKFMEMENIATDLEDDVLNTLGDNIQTNISFDDMGSFIALSKQLDTQNKPAVLPRKNLQCAQR